MKRLLWACRYFILENQLLRRFLTLQRHQLEEHDHIVKEVRESRRQLTGELATVIFKLSSISDSLESVLEEMKDDDGEPAVERGGAPNEPA